MSLDAALLQFREMVQRATGSFVTLDRSTGYWCRKMQPGLEIKSTPQSEEAIIVKNGMITVKTSWSEKTVNQGEVIFLVKGKHYRIGAGPEGAEIEYKFS